MRLSRGGSLRGRPGRGIGPRAAASTARDDHAVSLGGTPRCHRQERPGMRDADGSSRAAPRHTRGTASHRSVTAPLPERRRAHTTTSSRSTTTSHGGPASQVSWHGIDPRGTGNKIGLVGAERSSGRPRSSPQTPVRPARFPTSARARRQEAASFCSLKARRGKPAPGGRPLGPPGTGPARDDCPELWSSSRRHRLDQRQMATTTARGR